MIFQLPGQVYGCFIGINPDIADVRRRNLVRLDQAECRIQRRMRMAAGRIHFIECRVGKEFFIVDLFQKRQLAIGRSRGHESFFAHDNGMGPGESGLRQ